MKAFVTGATGFVGSAVVRSLLRRDIAVRVLARPTSDLRNIAGLDVEVFYGDLLDSEGLARGLDGCDTLYHVAGFYSVIEADSARMYEVNVRGTKSIMNAALRAGMRRAVHTSTIGTIGQPLDGTLATEDTPFNLWDGASDYVKSKYLGESVALGMCDRGLPGVVVHPCAPVGPRDIKPTSTGQRIVDYLRRRQPSFVPGGINYVAVNDVAEGEVLATEKGRVGERYILGNLQGNLALEDFCSLMERLSGVRLPRAKPRRLTFLRAARQRATERPDRGFRPMTLTCDPSKAIRDLGLPQTPLEEAFAEAIAWFRDNGYTDH
jgi:dihydroflavonol-4-reductase